MATYNITLSGGFTVNVQLGGVNTLNSTHIMTVNYAALDPESCELWGVPGSGIAGVPLFPLQLLL